MSDHTDDGLYAATINDNRTVFCQYCYLAAGNRFSLLANDIDCEIDSNYPTLVNSASGTTSLEMHCFSSDEQSRMAFTDFDSTDGIARKSKRLMVAYPMKTELFQVNRFSLDCGVKYLTTMR